MRNTGILWQNRVLTDLGDHLSGVVQASGRHTYLVDRLHPEYAMYTSYYKLVDELKKTGSSPLLRGIDPSSRPLGITKQCNKCPLVWGDTNLRTVRTVERALGNVS